MDKRTLKMMLSSNKKDYGTPKDKFAFLNFLFEFKIDLCAQPHNAKLKNYYSPEDDAFTKKWKKTSWMNPQFGDPEKACKEKCTKKKCKKRGYHIEEDIPGLVDWIGKAKSDSEKYGSTIVCLVPARTDTGWMQIAWDHSRAICFVKGRWQFEGAEDPSPFPLAIFVFAPKDVVDKRITVGLSKFGNVVKPQGSSFSKFKGKR